MIEIIHFISEFPNNSVIDAISLLISLSSFQSVAIKSTSQMFDLKSFSPVFLKLFKYLIFKTK